MEFLVGFTLTFTWRPKVFAWVNPLFTYLTAPIRARAWAPLWKSKSLNVFMCQYSQWNEKRRTIRPKPKLLSSSCVILNWQKILFLFEGATYTANLASFLIVQRFQTPIQSVEDLARQTKIKYGIPGEGQTQTFFQSSSIPTYVTMWEYMKSSGTILRNATEGIERVRKENFAFIFDSPVLEYHVQQPPCNTLHTMGR